MKVSTVLALLVLQCTRCLTIRVPVEWTDDSEVNKSDEVLNTDENEETTPKAIYRDYFQYTGQKPQFAIEVAAEHGVAVPEDHYKSYPVRPHTNLAAPVLGQHHILDPKKNKYHPYQKFAQKAETASFITPASTSFEVYHPYKAEEPYLQQIYKDPVLTNIRNDLRDSKNRLQQYEHDAGQSDVRNKEYLERPHEIDSQKRPHKNIPTHFEIHRPHRRPIYYRPPFSNHHRDHFLNNKLKSPWKTNTAKITPAHYRPIKQHLHGLRQQHAIKFDDEHNEYPQQLPPENFAERPEGYDIYEKGKSKYTQIKNNVGKFINKGDENDIPSNNPNLETYTRDDSSSDEDDEEEFVPIKNYAQVRKTETTKHLPKEAAIRDAESLEDIENAPRLREAIKSTKAQTVYSEEGYEDGAYDHAGEQKHASDHEGHGGYLKENVISGGKFKAPSLSASNDEAKSSAYKDEIVDGRKWTDSKKQINDEAESDDYTEGEGEHSDNIYIDEINENDENDRHKRNDQTNLENMNNNETEKSDNSKKPLGQVQEVEDKNDKSSLGHGLIKRETSLTTPEVTLIPQLESLKQIPVAVNANFNNINFKYPYYLKKSNTFNKNSPIRYAENFLLIPKKTRGGTEFYDSKAYLECPEVVSEIDPIPEKLKKGGHPDDNEESINGERDSNNKDVENKQRLIGLGDKIDCFKVKYFGENPLDSPFFSEDKIENPEAIILENLTDIFHVLEKIHGKNKKFPLKQEHRNKKKPNPTAILHTPEKTQLLSQRSKILNEDADTTLPLSRKKRGAPFIYEPYKIIKDSQIQDSKKTTTLGNISPLIKQLQSSRVIDQVSSSQDKNQTDKIISNPKSYKDISKKDRQKYFTAQNDSSKLSFVDESTKQRRGDTRFEIKPKNHKSSYSLVDNKRTMSIKDYEMRTNGQNKSNLELNTQVKPVNRYYFDVSQYLPQNLEAQNIAASTVVRKVIRTTTPSPTNENTKNRPSDHTESEEYDEYEDDEEEETDGKEEITSTSTTSTTTTTTRQPVSRKRIRGTTTTVKVEVDDVTELPKLQFVTRFNSPKARDNTEKSNKKQIHEHEHAYQDHNPKYTEMKKKSRTRTLVTDTKVYGDENEEKENEEVDKLIGVKQDMNDYLPLYEKDIENSNHGKSKIRKTVVHDLDGGGDDEIHRDDTYDKNENHKKHVEDDDNDEIDEDGDDDDDDDDDDDNDDDEDDNDDEDDSEEEDEDEDANDDKGTVKDEDDDGKKDSIIRNEDTPKYRLRVTTSEPTKRTLARTTETPIRTTVSNMGDNKSRPFQIKKKIEIHKEIPMNKSSPNVTQFKQDIKEIEIIRKTPPRTNKKGNKNLEVLDLYRDENLAKDINKLGGVEVFKENLDLKSEPRHGGNYRSINDEIKTAQLPKLNQDVETSESEPIKRLKLGDDIPRRSGKRKSNKQDTSFNADEMRSNKNIELSDSEKSSHKSLRGGNPRLTQRRENKNAQLVELVEDEEHEEIEPDMHGGNFKSFGSRHQTSRGDNLHGGNYRSARIIEADKTDIKSKPKEIEETAKAAAFLEGYARAVPILTTTPVYILDPSKRMYYYVDT